MGDPVAATQGSLQTLVDRALLLESLLVERAPAPVATALLTQLARLEAKLEHVMVTIPREQEKKSLSVAQLQSSLTAAESDLPGLADGLERVQASLQQTQLAKACVWEGHGDAVTRIVALEEAMRTKTRAALEFHEQVESFLYEYGNTIQDLNTRLLLHGDKGAPSTS
jgi:hypothetical protein